jgi:hypothetical protein
MRITRTLDKKERGQSLLELAVSMTVLLILLAGIVDIGRVVFHYITMRDAVQEASTYGAVYPTHCDQIRDRAYTALDESQNFQIDVKVDGLACASAIATTGRACHGKELLITVRDPDFPITMPLLGSILGRQTIPLEAHIAATILRPPC